MIANNHCVLLCLPVFLHLVWPYLILLGNSGFSSPCCAEHLAGFLFADLFEDEKANED